ncbi:uncharacterized protein TNCV_3064291 [Trichonephila clavipes]|nr:uncharacterized protein TNCV_3064291 [Trichonephila clavipes]
MTRKSPFAIQKSVQGIGGDPKAIKKLRSGDLLVETVSALQTKSFLLAKSFLDCPLTASPHKSLNSGRGVISEPDLLCTSDAEILEVFSYQGVVQVRRITLKKDAAIIPTKHTILTFNSPKLPTTIKASYFNCKIRPYIPNPLRCFKCQRFGHSQNSCRGQLTCSRCATVGHSSTDCTLEPKCINCSQPHSSDSKLCSKWKTEKQIQEIKTNRNITYLETRKLIVPPISQLYAQATKSSKVSATTQTDENITKIKCPPLKLLQQPSSLPKPNISPSIPSTSASSAQADLTSTSPIEAISESEPVNPISNNVPSTSNISSLPSNSSVQPTSASTFIQDTKQKAKTRARKRKKELLKKIYDAMIEIKMAPQKPRKSTPEQDSEDEDMIEYNPDEFDPDEYVQKYYDIGEYTSVITPTCYKNVKR